ncbi:alpha/beta fold hydrolase [Saccharothrix algeriensis]|uniref:Pimeloyl-ACP methyl ester carboxylesterase n=1 Tax=Saccharothrix algeriensis TaxID=173560 RepID=A0ABS2S273_9PSEU|nr:alpha/beta fold hydrolase [Saccharothrix algeriensis]MBM7810347.1 pimeloyl-ACP methyl ester carboxylesterase [Saccharothrix algeriensis]
MTTSTTGRAHAVEEHWTVVDGTETRYLEAGRGSPVVLLHGEGGVAEQWHDVLQGLAAGHHRAVAVDLPGYGYTKPIPDSSPAALAAFVHAFTRTLRLERHALVGHSLGGGVAVTAALQRPDRLSALVLVSPSGMGRAINPAMVVQSVTPLGDLTVRLIPVLPFGPKALVGGTALIGARRPWRMSALWWSSQVQAVATPGSLTTSLNSMRASVGPLGQRNLALGRLPELSMPTLVAWGLGDLMVPFWQGIAARRRLRRGRLRLFPGAGHLLPVEAPEALLGAVLPFLAGAATPGTAVDVAAGGDDTGPLVGGGRS